MSGRRSCIVAVDGPAASGKTTLARRLAAEFGLAFLDTGLLYRAVARRLLDRGLALDDVSAAVGGGAKRWRRPISPPRACATRR